jgi:hypothetical protein
VGGGCCLERSTPTRFVTHLGAFGAVSMKPIELYTTLPSHLVSQELVQGAVAAKLAVASRGTNLAKRGALRNRRNVKGTKSWPHKHWVHGGNRMSDSSAYPEEFGAAVAKLVSQLA